MLKHSIDFRAVLSAPARLTGTALLPLLAVTLSATAQQGNWGLEEVFVTAEKRSENVLDVPASVSAFSAEKLEASGIENVLDLANFTPGLSVEPSRAGGGSLYIRGIGSNLLGAGVDPSVAVYHDNAYVARHVVAFQDFIDVERVEVLRGPQGTLYGRNATGGAINVIHKTPNDEFELEGRLDGGNYDKQGIAVAVSGPIVADTLFGRASFSKQQRESYFTNAFLNNRVLDGDDSQTVALALVFQPTDNFEAILRYNDYQNDALGNIAYKNILRGPSTLAALPEPADEFVVNNDYAPGNNNADTDAISLELIWSRGELTLKSLTAQRDISATSTFDTDGTNLNSGFNIFVEDSEMFSQEFQLAMPLGDSLELIAGLYYYEEENSSILDFQFPNGAFSCGFVGQAADCAATTTFRSSNDTEAYAVFGELTWAASDTLRVTFGARYSDEEKSFASRGGFENFLFDVSVPGVFDFVVDASGVGTVAESDSWSDVTGRIVVEYDLSEELMTYASVSQGFKSGGFNSSDVGIVQSPFLMGAGSQGSFDPETITSYELGIKGAVLDGRVRGSLSGFYYDYKDLQVRFVDSVNATLPIRNAASANIFGVEFEGEAALTEQFRLDWAITALDSEYEDFGSAQDARTGDQIDLSGAELLRTPGLKASLGAQYTMLLDANGTLTLRGEYLHQDEQNFGQSIDPFFRGGEYDYLNARLTWASAAGHWNVAVWGQNLNEEIYESTVSYNNLNGGAVIYATPRTYGLTVGYNY